MKRMVVLAVLTLFLGASLLFSADVKDEGFPWAPAVLLTSDVLFVTASIMALVQQNTLSSDYETLRLKIDNTTDANYYRLLYEKEKVNSASDTAVIACTAAGIALGYTLADYCWFHSAFKASFAFTGSGAMLGMTTKY